MRTSLLRKAQSKLGAYRLLVYRRCPKFHRFKILDQRTVKHDQYEFESWLLPGGHIVKFADDKHGVIEVVTSKPNSLTSAGRVASLHCADEAEHEERFGKHINYITSVETEIVSGRVYDITLQEMEDFAKSQGAQHCRWQERNSRQDSLSVVDVQRYHRELHVQTWHLDAPCQVIVRSQAIFELVNVEKGEGVGRLASYPAN